MTDRHEDVILTCPNQKCGAKIEISKNWTAGGINDYGGWVLKCTSCSHVFDFRLGRDVSDSSVKKGATIIDTYFDESENKDEVLNRHGLT